MFNALSWRGELGGGGHDQMGGEGGKTIQALVPFYLLLSLAYTARGTTITLYVSQLFVSITG